MCVCVCCRRIRQNPHVLGDWPSIYVERGHPLHIKVALTWVSPALLIRDGFAEVAVIFFARLPPASLPQWLRHALGLCVKGRRGRGGETPHSSMPDASRGALDSGHGAGAHFEQPGRLQSLHEARRRHKRSPGGKEGVCEETTHASHIVMPSEGWVCVCVGRRVGGA